MYDDGRTGWCVIVDDDGSWRICDNGDKCLSQNGGTKLMMIDEDGSCVIMENDG